MPPDPIGSKLSTGVPRLPPTAALRPTTAMMWPIRVVVVDLPLVPVMPMKAQSRSARPSSSMSQITSIPIALARSATGCGLGKVWGMPGDQTMVVRSDRSAVARSTTAKPSASAAAREAGLSSHTRTSAPLSRSARAVARPDLPSPITATGSSCI